MYCVMRKYFVQEVRSMLKCWIFCVDALDDVSACTSIVWCHCECVMSCNFDWYAPLSDICEGCALTAELGLRISFSPILSFLFCCRLEAERGVGDS